LELGEVVVLADEPVLVEHVQLLAGGQLLATEDARETFQMIDARARSTYQLARTDLLLTTAALGSEPSTQTDTHTHTSEPTTAGHVGHGSVSVTH